MVPTRDVHPKINREDCIYCGNCCQLSARFFGDEEGRERVIGEIRKRSNILEDHGLDIELVIEHIRKYDRLPQRGEMGLVEENWIFKKAHCSLLVTDDEIEGNRDYEYD